MHVPVLCVWSCTCKHVCTYVCIYVCMYVCVYVCNGLFEELGRMSSLLNFVRVPVGCLRSWVAMLGGVTGVSFL